MNDPFSRPPELPGSPTDRPRKPKRTRAIGFEWSSPSRTRVIAGIVLFVVATVPFAIYTNENGSDHPALLVIAIPMALVGFTMAVWRMR